MQNQNLRLGVLPEYTEGMWKILQAPKPDDYVLATGSTHTVKENLLKRLSDILKRKYYGKEAELTRLDY